MKNKKLNLTELKVQSFVTEIEASEKLIGGKTLADVCDRSIEPRQCLPQDISARCNTRISICFEELC